MNKSVKISLILIIFLLFSVQANAQQDLYTGASLISTDYDDSVQSYNAIGLRLFAGLNLSPNFALEAGYVKNGMAELGQDQNQGISVSGGASGFDVFVIGKAALSPDVSIYGKLGIYRWDYDGEFCLAGFGCIGTTLDDGTNLKYGIGAEISTSGQMSLGAEISSTTLELETDTETFDMDLFGLSAFIKLAL